MSDYEATAFELVEQLKMKQDQELLQMQETMTNSFIAKYKWSKDLIEMKKQEKIYFSIKDYDNAERTRLKIQIQE